jgi:hypothetical protein
VTPLYPQKLALTSPTGGGRSVGIVRSRNKATEFSLGSFHSLQMELAKKFRDTTTCRTLHISELEVERKYPIVGAERVYTRYGEKSSYHLENLKLY